MARFDVVDLSALEILDSRGRPTLAVTVRLADGTAARAGVPSGASTGSREAVERRDGDPDRYEGKGVLGAVSAVNTEIRDLLRGRAWGSLAEADQAMIDLDGTANKSRLGANATVFFAIHPVAGRMPGHMNVLLAEANVPYEDLKEMDAANPEFPTADVALVVGANDVTNPAARRPGNPVSGMPILNVDQARNVIVIKRSMGHGYAGMDNELYTDPKTGMFFSDAKAGLAEIIADVKALVPS